MSLFSDFYENTGLGHAGQVFNDHITAPIVHTAEVFLHAPADIIGGAGQAYNDLTGGIRGAYAGTGQVLNRTGNSAANAVEQAPVIVRDITAPAGTGFGHALEGVGNLATSTGQGLQSTGTGLGLGMIALLGLGAYLLIHESKTGTVTRSAAAGATHG